MTYHWRCSMCEILASIPVPDDGDFVVLCERDHAALAPTCRGSRSTMKMAPDAWPIEMREWSYKSLQPRRSAGVMRTGMVEFWIALFVVVGGGILIPLWDAVLGFSHASSLSVYIAHQAVTLTVGGAVWAAVSAALFHR